MPTNDDIRVRAAMPADVVAIASLVNTAYSIETFIDGTRTDEPGIREMMEKGEFLLAEDFTNGTVACVYIEVTGQRGYFGMLAVHPAQQGKGLGRFMVEAAEEYCRRSGCTFMEITLLSLRTELPPFYQKFGYARSRMEQFHTSRRLQEGLECHCIVMAKRL